MRPVRWCRITNDFAAPGLYGSRSDAHGPAGHHTGIDFGKHLTPYVEIDGKPVRSCTPGTVVISGWDDDYGNWIGVYYAKDDVTLVYCHLRDRQRQVGAFVKKGDVLGHVGNTGRSTAPHLHVQANRGRGFDYHGHIPPGPWCRGVEWWHAMTRKRRARRSRTRR